MVCPKEEGGIAVEIKWSFGLLDVVLIDSFLNELHVVGDESEDVGRSWVIEENPVASKHYSVDNLFNPPESIIFTVVNLFNLLSDHISQFLDSLDAPLFALHADRIFVVDGLW